MKRTVLLVSFALFLFALPLYAIPPSPPPTAGTGDMTEADYVTDGKIKADKMTPDNITTTDHDSTVATTYKLYCGETSPNGLCTVSALFGLYPTLSAVITGGSNNTLFGINGSGTYGFYANHSHDNSAAQFYDSSAPTKYITISPVNVTATKTATFAPTCTDNCTLGITSRSTNGTLVTLDATETLTNKTLTDAKLDQTVHTSNGTWSGNTITFADCAASLAFGTPVYIQSTGKPAAANADNAATMPAIGVIVVASVNADDTCTVLTHGVASATAWPNFTAGNTVYIDDSGAGVLTATVGDVSGTDHVVQIIGVALGQDTVLINPSFSTITLE